MVDVEFLGEGPSPFGDTRIGFSGSTIINREDWGLTWNMALETGGVLVGKDIKLNLDVQAILVEAAASVS
jgi:polyisoprenoid-binding protein YceI